MSFFRDVLLAVAIATSGQALVVHSRDEFDLAAAVRSGTIFEPAKLSRFYKMAEKEIGLGSMGTEEELQAVQMPFLYKHERALALAVRSGLTEKDELKKQRLYVKLQAVFARAWGLPRMSKSFDAYWATLPKHSEEVTVEDFKQAFQSLGVPHAIGSVTRLPTSDEELNIAKDIDIDGSGAISKKELQEYIFACFDQSWFECGATFEGECSEETGERQFRRWMGVTLDPRIDSIAADAYTPSQQKAIHADFERSMKLCGSACRD